MVVFAARHFSHKFFFDKKNIFFSNVGLKLPLLKTRNWKFGDRDKFLSKQIYFWRWCQSKKIGGILRRFSGILIRGFDKRVLIRSQKQHWARMVLWCLTVREPTVLLARVKILSLLEGLESCLPISVVQLVLQPSGRSPSLGRRFDDQFTNTTKSLNCLSVQLNFGLVVSWHLPVSVIYHCYQKTKPLTALVRQVFAMEQTSNEFQRGSF